MDKIVNRRFNYGLSLNSFHRREFIEHHAVRGDGQRQRVVGGVHILQVFLPPQIADMECAGELERAEVAELQSRRVEAEVEKADRAPAVFQLLFIYLHVAFRIHARGLLAERILVQRQHLIVAQQ